jgi:hypothetical protein
MRDGELALAAESDKRSQNRSNVFLTASLVSGAEQHPVRVRNLSARGALLDGRSLPPAGARIRLIRAGLSADGEVAWQAHGHAGIRFTGEINVDSWVRGIGHAGQLRVDKTVASLRRQPGQPLAEKSSNRLSLGQISRELDAVCERLAASPELSVEVGEELLKIDVLSRALQQIADGEC